MRQFLSDSSFLSMSFGHLVTLFALVKIVMPTKSCVRVIYQNVKDIFHSRRTLFYFLSIVTILFINYYYTRYCDEYFTKWVGRTYEGVIYRIEGNIVPCVQNNLKSTPLTVFLSIVYIFIYPNLVAISIIILNFKNNTRGLVFLWLIFFFNYFGAIPFYMFTPVNEVWTFLPDKVIPLMEKLFPGFVALYRPMSGIDNCFPSLHTSIALSTALCAFRANDKPLFYFNFICTLLIILSVLYLGIHWTLDVVSGIIFASLCYMISAFIQNNFFEYEENNEQKTE